MTDTIKRFGEIIRKWLARSIETPSQYALSTWSATLSFAQVLLELVDSRFLPDIERIKEANLQAIEAHTRKKNAEADKEEAEAKRKLSEAVDAANQAALHKRHDAIARAEKDQKIAEAAKTQAEADAVRMDAETRRITAIAEAQANLLSAISQLRQEGGEFFVDKKNLEQILNLGLPESDSTEPEV
tara:strand:+ start:4372 stop:4929 length:558 start_codon:yes stop_codon:yes gene_type:complete